MLVAVLEEEVGEEEEDDTDGREGKARALLAAVRFTTIFSRLFFCLLLLSIFWKIFISFLLKEKNAAHYCQHHQSSHPLVSGTVDLFLV